MKAWTSRQIKALRKRFKLSQKVLAELTGVTPLYISYLERGVKTPSKTVRLLLNCIEEKEKEKGE